MNEKEKNEKQLMIDSSIIEIFFDYLYSNWRFDAICEFVESKTDIDWGNDILPSFQRLGLLSKYWYEIKPKIKSLTADELDEIWDEHRKAYLERNKDDFYWKECNKPYEKLDIRKKDETEEMWERINGVKAVAFHNLKCVDVIKLLEYPELEQVDFNDVGEIKNLHLLQKMPKLRRLSFWNIRKFTSEEEKISLHIEWLNCYECPEIAKKIIHNPGIKFMNLRNMDMILDLNSIGSYDTLEFLIIEFISKVVNQEALKKARNLLRLSIFCILPGDDWSVIDELPKLRELRFNTEATVKNSFCEILPKHQWEVLAPKDGELSFTTLRYLETFKEFDIHEHLTKKGTTYCVFGDFLKKAKVNHNVLLENLVKQSLKQKKIKTKYLFDSETGMFSVDSPTLEGAHQLIEILHEIIVIG
jgi:hypothetical protein